MPRIVIDKKSLKLSVDHLHDGLPVRLQRIAPSSLTMPEFRHLLTEALGDQIRERDYRRKKGVAFSLPPIDPWLMSLAVLMWEGIVQGLAWNALKVVLRSAIANLQEDGLIPRRTRKVDISTDEGLEREMGLRWEEWSNEGTLKTLFVGLRTKQHKRREVKREGGTR